MGEHEHAIIRCDQLLGLMSDYLDGQAKEDVCREIEQHMAGCNKCRVVVDTTRKTISLGHACNDKPLSIPDDVRERLFKRLDLDDHLQPSDNL